VANFRVRFLSFVTVLLAIVGHADAATLSGRVTRSSGGTAIAGASVFLIRTPFTPAGQATTDANGNFAFANLVAGTYIAGTQPDGFVGEVYDNVAPISFASATPIPLAAADVRNDIDFALDALHRVSGVVRRDGDATPVEGTTVTMESTGGAGSGSALTDASGAFAVEVPAGQYRARTDSAGGLLGEYSDGTPCTVLSCDGTNAATIDVADQDIPGVDFSLARGGAIAGQLRDAVRGGIPIRPVRVEIHAAGGSLLATAVESDTGAYQTDVGLPAGSYLAVAGTASDYIAQVFDDRDCPGETIAACNVALGDPVVIAAAATTAGVDFDLTPSTAMISGTVTALAGGAPLADVRVVLTTSVAGAPVQETLTAADGSYGFTTAPGTFFVYAEPAPPLAFEYFPSVQCDSFFGGCFPAPPALVLSAGASRTDIDFALAPIATVEVALRNASTMQLLAGSLLIDRNGATSTIGTPGAAAVLVPVPNGGELRFAGPASTGSGASGDRACLARLYPDLPCANLRCRFTQGTGIAVAKGGSVSGIELLLTPAGSIAGKVTRTTDGSGVVAFVEASVGVLVVGEALVSTADGAYEITGLGGGPHVVRASAGSGLVDEVYDDVPCPLGNCSLANAALVSTTPGARTENIDFALSPGATIGGTVRKSAGGSVIGDATITIFGSTGTPIATLSTQADGTFVSPGLLSGRYYVRAEARNHLPKLFDGIACTLSSCAPTTGTPIDLAVPANRSGVDFVLEADPNNLAAPTIVYLNRCVGGCTVRAGFDSSINNTSSIVPGTGTLAPFALGDQRFAELAACIANVFSPFNIRVTTTDPGNVPHHENMVVPSGNPIGYNDVSTGGVSPFSCGVINNAITFTFTNYFDGDFAAICDATAMEIAHSFGLEHEMDCRDPMTYLPACGQKFFVDAEVSCGELSAQPCECRGGTTQNSFQLLLGALGPKVQLFADGFETTATLAQMTKAYEQSAPPPRGPYCATRGRRDP
jgi:hypothetical protein